LWQRLRNQDDNVDIYVTWRDCTLEVETFTTSGSSAREIYFRFDSWLSRITEILGTLRTTTDGDYRLVLDDNEEIETFSISFSLSANDSYNMAVDDNLFMIISGGNPIPDNFVYRVEYKD